MRTGFCIKTFLSVLFCIVYLQHTEAQTPPDLCAVTFQDHYNVSETAPPNTEILSIPKPATGVSWSMTISYAQLPNKVIGLLDSYLLFQTDSSGQYWLTVNKTLDLEDIVDILGVQLSAVTVRLSCKQPGRPKQHQEVFVEIEPVNEYYPEFIGSPFTVDVSEKEAVGFSIISLDRKFRDLDIRPSTGEIYAFSIEPFDYARYHGKPKDDGRDYFTMSNAQKGSISIAKALDFEQLDRDNLTTMWLNVTVMDYSRNTNWTTVTVKVTDYDDLSPEFYVSGTCVPRPLKVPPCYITFKARILVNTTGKVNHIEPGPIFAHDRDTMDNPIRYSLKDSVGSPGVASHFDLDPTTGDLQVIRSFREESVHSVIIVAEERSQHQFTAQTTLEVNVYSSTYDPVNTSATVPSAPAHIGQPNTAGAVTSRPGSNIHAAGGGGGRKGTDGESGESGESKKSDDNSDQVPIIGMIVLGVLVVGLTLALFFTCIKLRHQRMGRVGSVDASKTSTKPFVNDEHLPDQSENNQLEKKRQQDILNNLPEPNERGNKLPPLEPSGSDAAPNPDVFDGTRSFEEGLGHEFFTAPGKIKVPLLPPASQSADDVPIFIDDGMPS